MQRAAPLPEAAKQLQAEGQSSLRRLVLACELYASRPCLGERATVVEDGETRALPAFRHITYAELWRRVESVAAGLKHLGLGEPGGMVGISGLPRIDGVVANLACLYLAAVSVPLSTSAPPEELRRIVADAGITSVLCGAEEVGAFAAALEPVRGLRVLAVTEVERLGSESSPVPPVESVADDALRSIVYTSGSTGTPKGAMFPERIWSLHWQRPWDVSIADIPWMTLDYMPLDHMAGVQTIIASLMAGGLTSFVSSSDMSTLLDDIRLARPTTLMLVPRVASLVYQHFQTEVMRRAARTRDVEAEVMDEMRDSFLGDRLVYLSTGSAPTAPEVSSFLERCFDVPVIDAYGSTELGLITFDHRLSRENVVAHELIDVPELGYTTRDQPYPRGELRVKTRRMVPGYYRSLEATRDFLDEEGFARTGDIMEQVGPEELAWIDRRRNVLKLAQGEFVSVSRLEEIYAAGSAFIGQVYLHGSSLWSYLLAVVVPEGTTDKALLREEIDRVAAREGLRSYEIPREFLLEAAPFTRENRLLTDSGKPSRPGLRARYGERLEQLQAEIARRRLEELQALESERGVPAAEKVERAFAATLGLPEREVRSSDRSFQKLGGDSIGAVEVVERIRNLCGVELPVALVLDPTSSVRALIAAVEERLSSEPSSRRVSFAEIHGPKAETVFAEDLRVERFIPSSELAAAGSTPLSGPPVIVLTGANGFLGRFLLLEFLKRAAASRGRVVAMVRAGDDAAARERLTSAYTRVDPKPPATGVDPKLAARFAALAADGRLDVVAADLTKPRLGLPLERWERLASEVTAVVHPGALVNHALSYRQLFEPNVLGTVEVMRLALRRRAPIGFVSTAGLAAGLDRADPIREDEDAAALWQRRPVDSGYAVGYSTSKWAGELLMRDLQARTGVPVSAFRPSMIMPPRSFAGQVNTEDFLTRLLQSLIVTGIAPCSFYLPSVTCRHFDGLPVDVVARDIAAVALATTDGYATYHVVDGHLNDGVSLDTFVEWVQRAGYPVIRIDDHDVWLHTLRERLEALTASEQQHSALAALKAWEHPIGRELALDNSRLRERLQALGEPPEMPHIDERTLRRYVENMVAAGLIRPPQQEVSARPLTL